MMRRVRRSGTPGEVAIARLCREAGLSYRRNVGALPGSPDLANKSKRWAIFVNGCFWHAHRNCPLATKPKRNANFWTSKFSDNRNRDARKIRELRQRGYRVAIFWQCELRDEGAVRSRLQRWAKRVS